jgi:hypothetical protein
VWPNLIVTDDTLVQSIGELRRAFAEAGREYITTVPRRGYRFEPPRAATPLAEPVKRAFRWRWKFGIARAAGAGPGHRHVVGWACGHARVRRKRELVRVAAIAVVAVPEPER